MIAMRHQGAPGCTWFAHLVEVTQGTDTGVGVLEISKYGRQRPKADATATPLSPLPEPAAGADHGT